jgi:Putative adhesin
MNDFEQTGAIQMPTFDTPEPISAAIDVPMGRVRVSAGERGDTIVEVNPSDPSNADDVNAAERTRVELANSQLVVKAPKPPFRVGRKGGGSVDVAVQLPAGSNLHGTGQMTEFDCDGRLAECRIKTHIGHIRIDEARTLSVKSGSGDVSARELDGSTVIKSANGDTWVGIAGGDLLVGSANGSIAVDRARASVSVKTAKGDVRLGGVERGSVALETQVGDLEVGIPEGTAAWLDVRARAGQVRNALDAADEPEPDAETVEVRARTSYGDVVIRRP